MHTQPALGSLYRVTKRNIRRAVGGFISNELIICTFLLAAVLLRVTSASTPVSIIRGVVYDPNGKGFTGTVTIVANNFGSTNPPRMSIAVEDGMLSVRIMPTTTVSQDAFYTATYLGADGSTSWTEMWRVVLSDHLSLTQVRTYSGALSALQNGSFDNTDGQVSQKDISLPIPISDVSGLNTSLTKINTSLTSLSAILNTMTSILHGLHSSTRIYSETPNGSVDGLNADFLLAYMPSSGTVTVSKSGQRQTLGTDYALSGLTISFSSRAVPQPGDTLRADYTTSTEGNSKDIESMLMKAINLPIPISDVSGLNTALSQINTSLSQTFATVTDLNNIVAGLSSNTPVYAEKPSGSVNGSNAVFTLTNSPSVSDSLAVYKNGVREVAGSDYLLLGNVLTFSQSTIPQLGDIVLADYVSATRKTSASASHVVNFTGQK